MKILFCLGVWISRNTDEIFGKMFLFGFLSQNCQEMRIQQTWWLHNLQRLQTCHYCIGKIWAFSWNLTGQPSMMIMMCLCSGHLLRKQLSFPPHLEVAIVLFSFYQCNMHFFFKKRLSFKTLLLRFYICHMMERVGNVSSSLKVILVDLL